MAAAYNMSVAVAYHAPAAAFSVAAGYTDAGLGMGTPTRKAQPDDTWVFGSITKMFTAPAVLQLVERGKVGLIDPITQHIDPVLLQLSGTRLADRFGKDVEAIQVQHLLHMCSGIADYDNEAFAKAQFLDPSKPFGPVDLLNYAAAKLEFRPGRSQSYSSTNYVLLGLLLMGHYHKEGEPWSWQQYDQRSVYPNELKGDFKHSGFVMEGSCRNFTQVHGFLGSYPGTDLKPQDVWNISCLGGWTAGDYVGTVSDLARFTYDLYSTHSPKIVGRGMQAHLTDFGPAGPGHFKFYGMGTFSLDWSIGPFGGKQEAYGHVGDTYGYQSQTTYFPADDFALTVGTNVETFSQAQPADTTCRAYHAIKAILAGKAVPSCKFETPQRFIGQCTCTQSREEAIMI